MKVVGSVRAFGLNLSRGFKAKRVEIIQSPRLQVGWLHGEKMLSCFISSESKEI
jgi:hypothetical protein